MLRPSTYRITMNNSCMTLKNGLFLVLLISILAVTDIFFEGFNMRLINPPIPRRFLQTRAFESDVDKEFGKEFGKENHVINSIRFPKILDKTMLEPMQKRLPEVIGIGVSKCGTRALRDFLNLHPDIAAAPEEINFFNNDTLYNLGGEYYRSLMPQSYAGQLTMEKSPDYFECERCLRRINKIARGVKLLIVLCEPIKRLISQYMQSLENHHLSGTPMPRFEKWVLDPRTGGVRADLPAVQSGVYHEILDDWYHFYLPERIFLIDGQALKQDPLSELKKVESFLGLKPYLSKKDIYFNATRGFFCLYKGRSLARASCMGKDKGRKHIQLAPDVYNKLKSFYNPHNEMLRMKYNFSMSWN